MDNGLSASDDRKGQAIVQQYYFDGRNSSAPVSMLRYLGKDVEILHNTRNSVYVARYLNSYARDRSRNRGAEQVLKDVGFLNTSLYSARVVLITSCAVLAMVQSALSQSSATKTTSGPIPDNIWQDMQGKSWHADLPCPTRENLVLLTVPFIGFDGQRKIGQLIVAKAHADSIAAAMDKTYQSDAFRIERMELVDKFGGDDDASMAANNTSAFNCRFVGGTTLLSAHALGIAIDINPIQNPFVTNSNTFPPSGKDFDEPHERNSFVTGIILQGDVITKAFDDQNWVWGGTWTRKKDYQHFSQNGK